MFDDFVGWMKDQYEDDPEKFARVASAIGVLVVLIFVAVSVQAKPVASLTDERGTTITLTDEDCQLKDKVNLPYRAVWKNKEKTVEGCYGGAGPFFIFYYADKDLGLVPMRVFAPLQSM